MRKKLLKVAFKKFAQSGYSTSITEIGKGAGIKKQSVYNHFANKDDLLYETIEIEMQTFYETKTAEFDTYMALECEEALKAMFFSVCNYFKDIEKIKFWRWILLIESKEFFDRCRDILRSKEKQFYYRIYQLIKAETDERKTSDETVWAAVQTFAVMFHGVIDGMLLYHDIYDSQILIENVWSNYWNSIEKIIKKK